MGLVRMGTRLRATRERKCEKYFYQTGVTISEAVRRGNFIPNKVNIERSKLCALAFNSWGGEILKNGKVEGTFKGVKVSQMEFSRRA